MSPEYAPTQQAYVFPYSLDCRVRSVTAVAQQAVMSVKLLCPSAHTLATTQPLSPAASTSTFTTHRATLGGCLYDAFMQPMWDFYAVY
jgi:hypothetical protein